MDAPDTNHASSPVTDGTRPTGAVRAADGISRDPDGSCRTRHGTFAECPLCGTPLVPEHAHFKCFGCGWRDSCCD